MTEYEDYRSRQAEISARTAQRSTNALAAIGTMPREEWTWLVSQFIFGACVTAATLADAFMSAQLATRPLGLALPDFRPRLRIVLASILDESRPLPRIDRLGRSEPQTSARNASEQVMRSNGVETYRWILDPDPCPTCIELGSRSWPISVPPRSHPNCECMPIPNK